MVKFNKKKL